MLPAARALLQKAVDDIQEVLHMKKTGLAAQCKNKNGFMNWFVCSSFLSSRFNSFLSRKISKYYS